jgi:hypothetical protein
MDGSIARHIPIKEDPSGCNAAALSRNGAFRAEWMKVDHQPGELSVLLHTVSSAFRDNQVIDSGLSRERI